MASDCLMVKLRGPPGMPRCDLQLVKCRQSPDNMDTLVWQVSFTNLSWKDVQSFQSKDYLVFISESPGMGIISGTERSLDIYLLNKR